MARFDPVTLLALIAITCGVLLAPCRGQDILGSLFRCRNEFEIDPNVFESLRTGDFSVRNPTVECFGECFVKRAGFMNDDFTFNRDTIIRYTGRFVSKEAAAEVYTRCTANVVPTLCVTAFEVYRCIYEHINQKWNTTK
ncbi:general odorant-binding protein 56d-like [Anopheles bellator]|uniref:general odorant-binding protein 56d-like n=1 Tax=Anopheles bellator TaxID=139047 RepID=UPI002649061C|nr:general odorant-binding protein 56d-like [Anopheles bellator]